MTFFSNLSTRLTLTCAAISVKIDPIMQKNIDIGFAPPTSSTVLVADWGEMLNLARQKLLGMPEI